MLDIEWLEPTSIPEAVELCARYGEEAKILAGGTWLAIVLRQGLLMPSALISLHRVPGLNHISYAPGTGLRLGALVTHRAVELDPTVRRYYPALAHTYGQVANVRVRHQATVGGNLCDADYASDPPAMLAALNAQVRLLGASGERCIAVREFITGHYETVIRPDELLVEVIVPELPAGTRGTYLKYRTRSSEDRPCVGVAAVAAFDPDGHCRELQVVVGAVAGRPQIVPAALEHARGERLSRVLIDTIAARYAEAIDPLDDLRGSAWYRKRMIEVFVRRALEEVARDRPGS
jgi:carbon-monoxide dehydrogenase medium subunit